MTFADITGIDYDRHQIRAIATHAVALAIETGRSVALVPMGPRDRERVADAARAYAALRQVRVSTRQREVPGDPSCRYVELMVTECRR